MKNYGCVLRVLVIRFLHDPVHLLRNLLAMPACYRPAQVLSIRLVGHPILFPGLLQLKIKESVKQRPVQIKPNLTLSS